MGTLIEDAAEVATLATAIDTAIVAQGGTLVGGGKLRNAAAGIATISGEEPIPDWTPPSEWPNLRTLLANDTETEYTGKTYVLFSHRTKDTITFNVPKWITSDGGVYYGNATHTWTSSDDYVWVCLYTNATELSNDCQGGNQHELLWICGNGTNNVRSENGRSVALQCIESGTCKIYYSGNGFYNATSLKRISSIVCAGGNSLSGLFNTCTSLTKLPNFSTTGIISANQTFSGCYMLRKVTDELDLSACTNCSYMFYSCYSLTAVPDELDLSACTNCSGMFSSCYSLTAVPDELDLSACTNCSQMFSSCYSLTAVPDELDLSACTNCSGMFYNCTSLTAVPDELDLSACTNCSQMFYNCYSLTAVPDELDLSACTNCSYMFSYCKLIKSVPDVLDFSQSQYCSDIFRCCNNLQNIPDRIDFRSVLNASQQLRVFVDCFNVTALPSHMTSNFSVDFGGCTGVSKDSVATFDSDGVVNGGFVYGLDSYANGAYQSTCPNSGQTITFSTATRNLFTSTEWTAVVTALTAKNWGVSPAA